MSEQPTQTEAPDGWPQTAKLLAIIDQGDPVDSRLAAYEILKRTDLPAVMIKGEDGDAVIIRRGQQ